MMGGFTDKRPCFLEDSNNGGNIQPAVEMKYCFFQKFFLHAAC